MSFIYLQLTFAEIFVHQQTQAILNAFLDVDSRSQRFVELKFNAFRFVLSA